MQLYVLTKPIWFIFLLMNVFDKRIDTKWTRYFNYYDEKCINNIVGSKTGLKNER